MRTVGAQQGKGCKTYFIDNCYPKQLKLDRQDVNHYLETLLTAKGGSINFRHWNKNHEHLLKHNQQKVYKHQDPFSYSPENRLLGTLIGEFTRIVANSDRGLGLLLSLWEKVHELRWMECPERRIRKALRRTLHKHQEVHELSDTLHMMTVA